MKQPLLVRVDGRQHKDENNDVQTAVRERDSRRGVCDITLEGVAPAAVAWTLLERRLQGFVTVNRMVIN